MMTCRCRMLSNDFGIPVRNERRLIELGPFPYCFPCPNVLSYHEYSYQSATFLLYHFYRLYIALLHLTGVAIHVHVHVHVHVYTIHVHLHSGNSRSDCSRHTLSGVKGINLAFSGECLGTGQTLVDYDGAKLPWAGGCRLALSSLRGKMSAECIYLAQRCFFTIPSYI